MPSHLAPANTLLISLLVLWSSKSCECWSIGSFPRLISGRRTSHTCMGFRMQDQNRGLVKTELGHVHYCEHVPSGNKPSGLSLMCMHMYPRSCDEFLEAGTRLAQRYNRRVVAIDALGWGFSDSPTRSYSIDDLADTVLAVTDHLGIKRFAAAGNLLGSRTCLVLSRKAPERIGALVLTNPYFTDKSPFDERNGEDPFPLNNDGSHLTKMWAKRSSFLDENMNQRAVLDEQLHLMKKKARRGNGVVFSFESQYHSLESVAALTCPTLILVGTEACKFFDSIGYDGTKTFARVIDSLPPGNSRSMYVEGGPPNLVNTHADIWVENVEALLRTSQ